MEEQDLISRIIELLSQAFPDFLSAMLTVMVIFIVLSTFSQVFRKGIKQSVRIAVIGQPRAGKTTLISVIFHKIMSSKIARNATVSGEKTVDRITRHMLTLRTGKSLASTDENSVFAFRFQIKKRLLAMIPMQFDVEIADFPGEYSEQLSLDLASREEVGERLVSKEFFSWVLGADKYVFVIDVERAISESESYRPKIDALIKNAVLNLKQELLDENVYERPVLVAFLKADTLFSKDFEIPLHYDDAYFSEIDTKSVGAFKDDLDQVMTTFSETIAFLKANFRRVDVVAFSSFAVNTLFEQEGKKIVDFTTP